MRLASSRRSSGEAWSGTRASVRWAAKGRRHYADLIVQFQSQVEGSRLRRAKWGNTVRSFLIHNGILLQAGVQA